MKANGDFCHYDAQTVSLPLVINSLSSTNGLLPGNQLPSIALIASYLIIRLIQSGRERVGT